MTAIVLRGDAARLPLPDGCVDLIMCSPPYFGLRSYADTVKCYECIQMEANGRDPRQAWPDYDAHVEQVHRRHYDGQIGSEATPREYLDALLACTREWVRVLKPSGSLFVNLGDKYAGIGGDGNSGLLTPKYKGNKDAAPPSRGNRWDYPPKSLLGLPWRYALACMDELGLIMRRDIVWHKCLSGGVRVYARMPGGDRPVMLNDLVRSYRPENVQLWNGERWTQVRGWERTPDRDGVLEVELRTGERIGCTPEHRWPTQRGVIRADEIRLGDVIQTTRLPEPDPPAQPTGLNDVDTGWLVGLYLAEGSRSGQTLQFSGHIREQERHYRLARLARAYHGTSAVYQTSENGSTCNVTGAILVGIIDHYVGLGRNAKTKRLRQSAWQRNEIFLAAVMEGYLSGDGHFDAKNDRWRLGFTDNDDWAADLRTLAARLGAKLSLRRAVHQMGDRRFPGWRGEWRWTRSAHHSAKQDGEVVAIRASRAREFYDVSVADDPHLFALASGVLTHNSNGLPESVTDRCRSSHEYLFHLVRQPRYYAAVDEIREVSTDSNTSRKRALDTWDGTGAIRNGKEYGGRPSDWAKHSGVPGAGTTYMGHPLGKLPGSVWTIPSAPLTVPDHLGVDHFAAYPPELVRRVVLGWSPPGVCLACGEGRRPVSNVTRVPHWKGGHMGRHTVGGQDGADDSGRARTNPVYEITGYACACTPYTDHPGTGERHRNGDHPSGGNAGPNVNAGTRLGDLGSAERVGPWREYHLKDWIPPPTRPALVLDPFAGTGTTMLVASAYGRIGIGVDRSADYCRLARWRTRDPGERARAMGVPKPPPVPDGQGSLFDDLEAS